MTKNRVNQRESVSDSYSLNKGNGAGMADVLAGGATGALAGIHNGLFVFQGDGITMSDALAAAAAVA